jgi:predicted dehydrogenase
MMSERPEILLVGVGKMGLAYAAILKELGKPFVALGRGEESAHKFQSSTGVRASTGLLASQLASLDRAPATAIVAVDTVESFSVIRTLLRHGVRNLLIEKPGAVTPDQIRRIGALASASRASVAVAYNRRFLESVRKARELIDQDGGLKTIRFEFTERSRRIAALGRDPAELAQWFLANSTHVVDLAFFLAGSLPEKMHAISSGGLSWHPSGSRFAGAGRFKNGAIFSYHADWEAPGNWGIELTTRARKLVFQPLETLREQGLDVEEIVLADDLDRRFKPGVYRQLVAFLTGEEENRLCTIEEHCAALAWYERFVDKSAAD